MLLRRKFSEASGRRMMSIGLLLVSLGLILTRIKIIQPGLSDFSQGFCLGLGIVLLGASIVFSANGLHRVRADKSRK